MKRHALIWPMTTITWCDQHINELDDGDGIAATSSSLTCDACRAAMEQTYADLREWLDKPKPETPGATRSADRLEHELTLAREGLKAEHVAHVEAVEHFKAEKTARAAAEEQGDVLRAEVDALRACSTLRRNP